MPDVAVKCSECGADRVVSEYATPGSFSCLVCQASLELPGKESASGLSIRRNPGPPSVPVVLTETGVEPPITDEEDLLLAAAAAAATVPTVNVHEGREIETKSMAWLGYLGFIAVAAALIGFQWKHDDFSQYETFYMWGRNLLVLGSYLIVVLIAFQDTTGAGALCLFFPPYILVYVSGSLESYLLRGVFLASLLALGTEVYFLGSESALSVMGENTNHFISSVDGLIKKASE